MSPRCGFVFEGEKESCPVCGARTATSSSIRALGWLAAACGAVLVLAMGAVILWVWPLLMNPGEEFGGTSFDGSPAVAMAVFGVLLLVFGIGVVALYGGVHQILTGRRDRKAVSIMIWLATAFFVIGTLAETFM
jgi:hypothetical protein